MVARYFFITFLIFLVACQPEVRTIHTSEYQPPVDTITIQQPAVDLCENINCTTGKICQEGSCTCPSGKKSCGDDCIASSDCCTDDDCSIGVCDDGECIEAKECRLNEEFDDGECGCVKDKVYCREQGKCIDRDACCIHTECDSFERCVPTNWKTSFCIKIEDKKICKLVSDLNRTETFDIKDNEFEVMPTDWWHDETISILVNNESMRLAMNETVLLEETNATIFHEGVEITGGLCKEDEDD